MPNYLLNLTGDFDAGKLLPVFLPFVAAGKLSLFHEITQYPLLEGNQNDPLLNRLKLLKDHFENQRLSLHGNTSELNIGIILGFEYWDFTQFGQISRLPLFKIKYLRKIVNELFEKQRHQLKIFYFITGLKSKPYLPIFNHIEKTGYAPDSDELPAGNIEYKWITRKSIHSELKNPPATIGQVREDGPITREMADALHNFKTILTNKLTDSFKLLGFTNESCQNVFLKDIHDRLSSIQTVTQFNATGFLTITDHFLIRHFSLKGNLLQNERAFRYFIDDSNVSANLISGRALACLMIEILIRSLPDFNDVVYYHQLREITPDEKELNFCFSRMLKLAENSKERLNKTNEESVIEYDFLPDILEETDSVGELNKPGDAEKIGFVSHENVRSALGRFFHFGLKEKIRVLLEEKSLNKLEDKFFSGMDGAFLMPEYLKGHKIPAKDTIRSVRNKLLLLQQNRPDLKSPIDHEKYLKTKHESVIVVEQKRAELLNSLVVLPKINYIIPVLALGSIGVLLGAFPLYTFKFPAYATGITFLFLILCILFLPLILFFVKKKLLGLLDDLEAEHGKLYNALLEFQNEILRVARDYRNTIVYRKKVEILEGIIKNHDEENLMKNEYIVFLNRIKSLIDEIGGFGDSDENNLLQDKTISIFTEPPSHNDAFTDSRYIGDQTKRVDLRFPGKEAVGLDVPLNSLLKSLEFE